MIESGKSVTHDNETVRIHSTSTLGNIRAIRELLLRERVSKTLEIGLAFGGSALTFLATLSELFPGRFHHSAIDPFQNTVWKGSALKAIKDLGFSEHFTHYDRFSAEMLPRLLEKNFRFGMIYIDGSHLFEDVFVDFYFSVRLLELGGILLFDDCRTQHVHKVLKFIRSNYADFLSEIDYHMIDDPGKPVVKRIGHCLGIRQLCGFKIMREPPRLWNAPYRRF